MEAMWEFNSEFVHDIFGFSYFVFQIKNLSDLGRNRLSEGKKEIFDVNNESFVFLRCLHTASLSV